MCRLREPPRFRRWAVRGHAFRVFFKPASATTPLPSYSNPSACAAALRTKTFLLHAAEISSGIHGTVVSEPPVATVPWMPLDISAACNRNVFVRKAAAQADGFEYDGSGVMVANAGLKEAGMPGPGLPDDGIVAVPGSEPAGRFALNLNPGKDTIWLSGAQLQPLNLALMDAQRRHCSRLAFLTASAWGNASLVVTVHYAQGPDEALRLPLHDWFAPHASAMGDSKIALTVQPRALQNRFDLYSQIVPVDPKRKLRGITFAVQDVQLSPDANNDFSRFTAGIFAISALPVARTASLPVETNEAVVTPPPAEIARPEVCRTSAGKLSRPLRKTCLARRLVAVRCRRHRVEKTCRGRRRCATRAMDGGGKRYSPHTGVQAAYHRRDIIARIGPHDLDHLSQRTETRRAICLRRPR